MFSIFSSGNMSGQFLNNMVEHLQAWNHLFLTLFIYQKIKIQMNKGTRPQCGKKDTELIHKDLKNNDPVKAFLKL
ncbi:hypothetical protein LguiB_029362 [Lonicera macranthoides]